MGTGPAGRAEEYAGWETRTLTQAGQHLLFPLPVGPKHTVGPCCLIRIKGKFLLFCISESHTREMYFLAAYKLDKCG